MSEARDRWLGEGFANGWISRSFCYVHDAPPITKEEADELNDNGGDTDAICIPVVRVWG